MGNNNEKQKYEQEQKKYTEDVNYLCNDLIKYFDDI